MKYYTEYSQSLEKQARQAEQVNNWKEAARLWRLAGRKEDADACQMIHDSNTLGDEYRAFILRNAGPEPEVVGPKEDSIKWMGWFREMEKAARRFGSFARMP